MNIQLSETQEMLRTSAREFLSENCPVSLVREMRRDGTGFPPALWEAMTELGWLGLSLPEDCGGSGMPFLDLCLLQEELGRACAPTPFIPVATASLLISEYGSAAQKNELLPRIATSGLIVVPALQPAHDGKGLEQPLTAEPSAGGWKVSGRLEFVPWAGAAASMLCPMKLETGGADTHLAIIPVNTQEISLTPLHAVGPDRLWNVELQSVPVTTDAVLAVSDARIVTRAHALMDTARCCDIVGALGFVLEATVAYAKDRRQFNRSIGSFQAIQHYCADMHIMLEGLRIAAYAAAWSLSETREARRDVAILCSYAHRVVPQILNLAHQVHGAMGVTQEHDLHLYTTRAIPPAHDLLPTATYLDAVLTE